MLWMRGVGLFVEEAWDHIGKPLLLQLLLASAWKDLSEVTNDSNECPGGGQGTAWSVLQPGGPVISQGVSGRCPPQEFDS